MLVGNDLMENGKRKIHGVFCVVKYVSELSRNNSMTSNAL